MIQRCRRPKPPSAAPTHAAAPCVQILWTFSIYCEAVSIMPQLVILTRLNRTVFELALAALELLCELFLKSRVCVYKPNPVNALQGRAMERILQPLVEVVVQTQPRLYLHLLQQMQYLQPKQFYTFG